MTNTGNALHCMAHLETTFEWVSVRVILLFLAGMREGCLLARPGSYFPAFIIKWSRSISQVPRQETSDSHHTAVSPWHCQHEGLVNSWLGLSSLVCWGLMLNRSGCGMANKLSTGLVTVPSNFGENGHIFESQFCHLHVKLFLKYLLNHSVL